MSQVIEKQTLHILTPADSAWSDYYQRLPLKWKDVFFTPAYAHIIGEYFHKNGVVHCALFENGLTFILYPFVLRELDVLLSDVGIKTGFRDIRTLYGPGGVVISNETDMNTLVEFHKVFSAWCTDQKVLCSFEVFHPVLANSALASPRAKLIDIGGFVVLDLTKPISEIEKAFKHSIRKNIKKAERAGVEIFSESTTQHLKEFLTIYHATMDRNDAKSSYYLEPRFYTDIEKQLPGHFRFFYARKNGVIVSCELVLISGHYAHSYLGGTLAEALVDCPNHLLKREIIRFVASMGCTHYLLGGGTTPFDGIWNYKKGFAMDGDLPSRASGTIFFESEYKKLREAIVQCGVAFPLNRFQFYDRG